MDSKKPQNRSFFQEILLFFRKIPIIREIYAFCENILNFVFLKTLMLNGEPKSRFMFVLDWFIFDIFINGLLWYAAIYMLLGLANFNFLDLVGIGLFRFVLLDLLQDIVKACKKRYLDR